MISALTASLVAGQFALTDIEQQLITDSARAVPGSSSSALGPLATSTEPAKPRLSRAITGEPVPLGLTLHGPADAGMELSTGSAVGLDGWEISANDLGYAWIAPPEGFVGSADLIAELRRPDGEIAGRQAITLEWVLPIAAVPVRQLEESAAMPSISPEPVQLQNDRAEAALLESQATPLRPVDWHEIAPIPLISPAPVQLQPDRDEAVPPEVPVPTLRQAHWQEIGAAPSILLEPIRLRPDGEEMIPAELPNTPSQIQPNSEEIGLLLRRGKDLIATGDFAAAPLVLRRAAGANNAEAALALAATYDPVVLRQLKVYGFTAAATMARAWYEKAGELGSSAAPRRLEMLTQEMGMR
jgi:hypothetical protein